MEVFLLHAGPAPLALDEVGGIQGAHTTFAGAKNAAHELAKKQEAFGDNQIVVVTASPTGLWNDGLFNLKHMFPGNAEPPDHRAVYYVHGRESGLGPPVGQILRLDAAPVKPHTRWKRTIYMLVFVVLAGCAALAWRSYR